MPYERAACIPIEGFKRHPADYGYVMVAQQTSQHGSLTDFLHTGIGVRAVSDKVAQAPGFVNLTGILQYGFESGVICMNV